MAHRLNLARRPFLDTRPANVVAGVLLVTVVVLSFVSVRTMIDYFERSKRTRESISALTAEIDRLEAQRRTSEETVRRFDLAELAASASDASAIARLRSFSWTRFLSRLETVLPADVRVTSISLGQADARKATTSTSADATTVELSLISRDPDGLPKTITRFYGSPYFDRPLPAADVGPGTGAPEGHQLSLSVQYRDIPDVQVPEETVEAKATTRPKAPKKKASSPKTSAPAQKPAKGATK